MIVGPLKSNIQLSIILLVLFCLGLWLCGFTFAHTEMKPENYKEHILFSFFLMSHLSDSFLQAISLVVILIGAFMINFLAIDQEITLKTNFLPAFFYILMAFSAGTKGAIAPVLVANVFILPAMYFFIKSYRQDFVLSELFKAGLFLGIASFFCIQYILLFPLSFISLIILRPFNWREWVVLFIGIILPLYIYLSICYLTNNNVFGVLTMMKEAISTMQKPIISEYYVGFLFITILALIFAIIHYLGKGFGGKVKTQKTKYILLWMFAFCFVMIFFEQTSDMILIPCIVPLSIIIGDYISEIKQLKIANTLLTLFLGGFSIIYLHSLGII